MSSNSSNAAPRPQAPAPRQALRFWEPWRIPYNLVLLAVTLGWFALAWPRSRAALAPLALAKLGRLAALANVCYSAAYLVEFALAPPAAGASRRWRSVLWWLGVAFAAVLAPYSLMDEVTPALDAPPAPAPMRAAAVLERRYADSA